MVDPTFEHAAAHGGSTMVEYFCKRVICSTRQVMSEFKVAPRRGIQNHRLILAIPSQ
ncbi:Uncharacterised protein [Vibrio cholerae]|nr:Uncharacterised protein [Vibrio cholerae]CSI52742.1 Uncharacterised protein [Vibrio cholerae]